MINQNSSCKGDYKLHEEDYGEPKKKPKLKEMAKKKNIKTNKK